MGLTKYSLGQLLDRNTETNIDLEFGISDVRGVLNSKGISNTKVNVEDRDLSKFLVVRPGGFIFNHRVHDKLGLGYNTTDETFIFTNDYVAFYVKPEIAHTVLLPDYLYMWFLRNEFDRYMLFQTYGSATLFFSWNNMIELEIDLPPLPIQQKYVAIYNAMAANQQSYERGLEDLRLVIESQLEKLKIAAERTRLGNIFTEYDEKNTDGALREVQGVNKDKVFMPTVASGEDLTKYKVVPPCCFACNFMHVGRDVALPIALNDGNNPMLVSPAYSVFSVDEQQALADYVLMWLSRDEISRYAWFLCDSSIRSGLEKKRFLDIEIPLPSIDKQIILVKLHKALITRQRINEQMKVQIRDICPILIKGSMEEGR